MDSLRSLVQLELHIAVFEEAYLIGDLVSNISRRITGWLFFETSERAPGLACENERNVSKRSNPDVPLAAPPEGCEG